MKRISIALLVVMTAFAVDAQTIEMEQDVNADTVLSNYGKNRKHFVGTTLGFGVVAGQTNSDSMQLGGLSDKFTTGIYYKNKVSKAYSILLSANYGLSIYRFKTEEETLFNRLRINEVNAEFGNRFNFGRRGNVVGNYLELGISGIYVFHTKQESKQKVDDPEVNYKSRKVEFSGLKYVEQINYAAHARLGFNKFAITAEYRLSDLLNANAGYSLPPLILGLRMDLGA